LARTTPRLVQDLIEDVNKKIPMDPFIASAGAMVDWLVTEDAKSHTPLLQQGPAINSLPELIERWLAAHFYSKFDTKYQQKMTGRASGSVDGQTTFNFSSSRWGQQAITLDVTGRLAERSKDAEIGLRRVASAHGGGVRSNRRRGQNEGCW
jgi:hypothetical protein